MKNQHASDVPRTCLAGGASCDITPSGPIHLYGYPHAERLSTGVHDPLLASAFYLTEGRIDVLFIQVDVIWLSKGQVADVRARIGERTGVPAHRIMLSASHTHSGPSTVSILSNADDPIVPPPSPDFVNRMIDGITRAAELAVRNAEPAEITISSAECGAIGGNRLNPSGPRITDVLVIAARSTIDPGRWIGLMFINPVHPTVLHADSTLMSGDFPAMCREFLRAKVLGPDCPVLCHLGAAGNQSPRYVTQSHTFAEASRLGAHLGEAIERVLLAANYVRVLTLRCETTTVNLPSRKIPPVDVATDRLHAMRANFEALRGDQATPAVVRTAECAVFGAEETLALARAAATGELSRAQYNCMPAEIQVVDFGGWTLVAWPGEVFVEFALQLRQHFTDVSVVTLANGELQGYLVTSDAAQQNCYEAGNAIFASQAAGEKLVEATLALLWKIRQRQANANPLEPESGPL